MGAQAWAVSGAVQSPRYRHDRSPKNMQAALLTLPQAVSEANKWLHDRQLPNEWCCAPGCALAMLLST
jgi:hypothetical protein